MENETQRLQYTVQKRKLFDKYYSHLNSQQRECIYTIHHPLMILAGAGSGKTTVLVSRLAYIIRYGDAYMTDYVPEDYTSGDLQSMTEAMQLEGEQLGEYLERFAVNPPPAWSVLAVTFTNKAAGEIKARLTSIFGEGSSQVQDIWTGTFHSVCMRILRRHGELVGYGSGFGIADTDDQKKLIAECMKQLNIDAKFLPAKSILTEISRAKNHLMTPEEYQMEIGSDSRLRKIGQVYELYQSRLQASNLLDFDDIIMQTVTLLQNFENVRQNLQNRFRYISIDEYQDTNRAQFELVSLLAGGYKNLMVVGDDDQSIYKFRGATIENILTFDNTYPNAKVIRLEQNYRSTKRILDAANAVIVHNKERKGKKLWTQGDEGEKILLKKLSTQLDEARFISDTIGELHEDGGAFSSFAVLYRTNAMSRAIEQALAKSGIPYRMLGALRFFDRLEIKDVLAYVSVVNNPADSVRLRRIINTPRRGIGEKSIGAAMAIADELQIPLLDVLARANTYTAIPSGAAKAMMALAELIDELRTDAKDLKISALIERICVKSGYQAMWIAAGEAEKERLDNIGELVSTAAQYESTTATPSLSEFLEDIALVSDIDRYDEAADAVVLMTIHSAKGLEFQNVFLPGWEEGIFPGFQSIMNPTEIEEERRLAYVAITRARQRLYITHVHQRMLNGSTQYNKKSRFAGEIPPWLLEEADDTFTDYQSIGERAYTKGSFQRSGSTPIYNKNAPGSGYGTGEERAAYTGNLSGTGAPRPKTGAAPRITTPASLERFDQGARVRHTTFGSGTVLSVKPMGADILYEVNFDKIGIKKLMASFARLKKE